MLSNAVVIECAIPDKCLGPSDQKRKLNQVHRALAAPFHATITNAQVLDTLVWLDAFA